LIRDLGLDPSDPDDLADYKYVFSSGRLRISLLISAPVDAGSSEVFEINLYRFAREDASEGDEFATIDADPLIEARVMGTPADVARAYKDLVAGQRPTASTFALVSHCPMAPDGYPCTWSTDAEFADSGSVRFERHVAHEDPIVGTFEDFVTLGATVTFDQDRPAHFDVECASLDFAGEP
jgi:hypothetical protein